MAFEIRVTSSYSYDCDYDDQFPCTEHVPGYSCLDLRLVIVLDCLLTCADEEQEMACLEEVRLLRITLLGFHASLPILTP